MRLHRPLQLLAALIAAACLPATTVYAAPAAILHVSLTPDKLGQSSTLAFRLHINSPPGQSPPVVTELTLNYPSSLGLAVGGLGPVSCETTTLEAFGPKDCPSNAHMGHGHALAEVVTETETIVEGAEIAILRAPEQQHHVGMYFDVITREPSSETIVPGALIPSANGAEEALQIKVPFVPVWPEGPYVSLIQLDASIGSNGLTYHERVRGHIIKYKPAGIFIPDACPHGGFRFSADLTFITGRRAVAEARVPCPKITRHH
jgi:hypothetical protein